MVQLSFPLTERDGYRLELAPFNNCSIYQLLADISSVIQVLDQQPSLDNFLSQESGSFSDFRVAVISKPRALLQFALRSHDPLLIIIDRTQQANSA